MPADVNRSPVWFSMFATSSRLFSFIEGKTRHWRTPASQQVVNNRDSLELNAIRTPSHYGSALLIEDNAINPAAVLPHPSELRPAEIPIRKDASVGS